MEFEEKKDGGGTTVVEPNAGGTDVKTFTQSEIDAIVEERLNREKKKYPTKEELGQFKSWKAQKELEEQENAKKPPEVDNSELYRAKSEIELLKLKANPDFMEFLVAKLSAMDGDFKENAETLKTESPQYFEPKETRRVSNSPRLNGGNISSGTSAEKMNAFLRGV